jgi:hypothetical protein
LPVAPRAAEQYFVPLQLAGNNKTIGSITCIKMQWDAGSRRKSRASITIYCGESIEKLMFIAFLNSKERRETCEALFFKTKAAVNKLTKNF